MSRTGGTLGGFCTATKPPSEQSLRCAELLTRDYQSVGGNSRRQMLVANDDFTLQLRCAMAGNLGVADDVGSRSRLAYVSPLNLPPPTSAGCDWPNLTEGAQLRLPLAVPSHKPRQTQWESETPLGAYLIGGLPSHATQEY